MVDIHGYHKRLEYSLTAIEKSSLSNTNKEKLFEFYHHCLADGISAGKIQRYLDDMRKFASWVNKDFETWTRKDVEGIIIKLEQSTYAEWTKYCYKVALRKFFKWLRGKDELPDEVRWVKLKMKNCNHRLPEELVTEQEVKEMIQATSKPRDKALIATLYESGCRIHELLNLKIKQVSFDMYGATITVSGKTGSRRVRLISSVLYLQDWLNKHPLNSDSDAFVWVKDNKKNEIVGYNRARFILQNIAKKAGVKKKVNPHNFRHARASFMANHLTESQLKEVFGWTQASRMASVYVHLSGKNTDQAVLKVYGKVIENEATIKALTPKTCFRCKTENEPTNKCCRLCGMILDEESYQELLRKESNLLKANELMDMLMKDKDVLALFTQKIKEVRH